MLFNFFLSVSTIYRTLWRPVRTTETRLSPPELLRHQVHQQWWWRHHHLTPYHKDKTLQSTRHLIQPFTHNTSRTINSRTSGTMLLPNPWCQSTKCICRTRQGIKWWRSNDVTRKFISQWHWLNMNYYKLCTYLIDRCKCATLI